MTNMWSENPPMEAWISSPSPNAVSMKQDIYICYSRKDLPIARAIKQAIEQNTGIGCMMDPTEPEGGKTFSLKTANDIRQCRVFAFILSENALSDERALLEMKYAADTAKDNGRHMVIVNVGNDGLDTLLYNAPNDAATVHWRYKRDCNNFFHDLGKWTGTPKKAKDKAAVIGNLIANMVPVEGGTFTMGSDEHLEIFNYGAESYPKPHQVTLSSFSIGRYEVTQEEWEAFMDSNPSSMKGERLPVDCVSWEDCQEFIRRLNAMTGKQFRLPTEAEWEYAARGGNKSRGYRYAGGDSLEEVAWYLENSGDSIMRSDDKLEKILNADENNCCIHPVGQKRPNELGLYDMTGNVSEWCRDGFYYYPMEPQVNPCDTEDESKHVVRGGTWATFADWLHVAARNFSEDYAGIRLVL